MFRDGTSDTLVAVASQVVVVFSRSRSLVSLARLLAFCSSTALFSTRERNSMKIEFFLQKKNVFHRSCHAQLL
jgi:hypothetical protein